VKSEVVGFAKKPPRFFQNLPRFSANLPRFSDNLPLHLSLFTLHFSLLLDAPGVSNFIPARIRAHVRINLSCFEV